MRASHLTGLRPVASATAALAIITILVLLGHADTAYAISYNPMAVICLDNENTADPDPLIPGHAEECDGDNAPGAASGYTITFTIPQGDSQFAAVITFLPPEWFVARGADVPDGALAGQLDSRARVGFLGNPCNSSIPVRFNMMDATIITSATTPFKDPQRDLDPPDGPDKDDKFGNEPDDQFDIPSDFGKPGDVPLGVSQYPDYLLRIRPSRTLDSPPLPVPIARLYGQTVVGTTDVSLNFLIFEPGETIGNTTMASNLGYPALVVLQDNTDPDMDPSPDIRNGVSSYCTPQLSVNTTFAVTKDNPNTAANEAGFPYRKNPPSDGTYNIVVWSESIIDTDNDGIENLLDPCPFDPDPKWDPRAANAFQPGADNDGDGIPNSCDPTPEKSTSMGDHDGDVYYNRADFCPLVANGRKEDNQEDSDFDLIGDACDTRGNGPNSPDGERTAKCVVTQVVIGAGGPAPEVKGEPCTAEIVAGTSGSTTTTGSTTPTTGTGAGTPTAGTGTPGSGGSGSSNGVGGDAATGVGSLAPAASSVPAWAAIASGLGVTGILGAIGATLSRIFRRRQRG